MNQTLLLMLLALILSGCSTKPEIKLAPLNTINDRLEAVKGVESIPIDSDLMTPCYQDLIPEQTLSTKGSDLVKIEADNYAKFNTCYKRQLDLILELEVRGYD